MYWLMSVSIAAASVNSTLLHKIPFTDKNDVFSFNFFGSVIWTLILLFLNKGKINLNSTVLFWGIIYGITQVLFLVFKTKAMSSGPISITTLIGNCSLLLSTSVSVIIWQEKISLLQAAGIIVLMTSVIICTYSKSNITMSNIWKFYSAFFLIFAAAVGIVFKGFSKSSSGENANDMMLVSAIVMSVLFFGISILKRPKTTNTYNVKYVSIIIICGTLSCMYNRLNIFLSGTLPAAFFFPAFNGGVIVLSSVMGMLLLNERLAPKQIAGLILGTISILVIGIF